MYSAAFAALAEPNRLRIVELLRDQPSSVNEIAARLDLRQPQTSKHLRALSDAGWVIVRPVAQRRIYVLRPEAFVDLDAWLGTFAQHWKRQFAQLDDYLARLKEQ